MILFVLYMHCMNCECRMNHTIVINFFISILAYYFRNEGIRGNNAGGATNNDTTKDPVMVGRERLTDMGDHYAQEVQGDDYRGFGDYKHCVHYVQTNTSASDSMHVPKIVSEDETKSPEEATIGDLVKKVGDTCLFTYDLGDCWYHKLEVEKVIPIEKADGVVVLMDGAMRCPAEDGDGCGVYQRDVLDLLLKVRQDPADDVTARKLANNCFENFHCNLNVMGCFRPEEFDLAERRVALKLALSSKNSTMNLTKTFAQGKSFGIARIGQRHIVVKKEHDEYKDRWGRPINWSFNETVNVKPDPRDGTLCYVCGNPHDLRACSRCKCTFYCSQECQAKHWANHKKMCKQEKAAYENYVKEVQTNKPDPNRFDHDGGYIPFKKFDKNNLRFSVGTRVECLMGENMHGTGRVVKLHYHEPNMPPGVTHPYQIKLDRETADRLGVPFQRALIYSQWDDDHQIRKLPELEGTKKKSSSKKGGKKRRGKK